MNTTHGMQEQTEPAAARPPVFALDIGTRSIIGVVGVQEDGLFRVLDIETREHTKRAMYDGQIEDIEQVAKVARTVKEELERRQKTVFQRVCVAAAGRALRTVRASHEMQLSPAEPITARVMYEMEMGAVSAAQEQLSGELLDGQQLHCVGHAVVRYQLDGYPFVTILNHRGSTARVEVIATFLPSEVVESLYAAMGMIGLEIDHMTLEPIAAMNAVIPGELRLLNLALVDIGAGTSDIAVSENGSVAAYTMATVAGDELTESIIHRYLVDFAQAEAMKHAAAAGKQEITYHDILGFEYEAPLADVLETIRPAVEELGNVICEKILEANGKPPAAVFLVGGGSRAPLLCELIADNLGLDRKKVAVGGNNFMKRVVTSELPLESPEYATPLGIALTAVNSGSYEGFFVTVNEKKMRVFRSHTMSVMDVLLLAGYKYQDLMGRNGKSLTYELNGEKRFLRGGYLTPAQITINGVFASISTPVANGDSIHVLPAVSGRDARLTAGELEPDPAELNVTFNGTPIVAGRRILVGGAPVRPQDEIHDLDKVEHYDVSTLGALCAQMGMRPENTTLAVNGAVQAADYRLQPGDQVICVGAAPVFTRQQAPAPPVAAPVTPMVYDDYADDEEDDEEDEAPPVYVPPAPPPQPAPPPPAPPQPAAGQSFLRVMVNDEQRMLPKREQPYQFLDMLNLVDIDPTKPQGNIILRLNGREAAYLEEIGDGDVVEICWDRE